MRRGRRSVGFLLTVLFLSGLVGPWAPGRGEESLRVSLEYSVELGAYENAVRVAPVTAILYLRIAVDRNPTSPFNGTVYLVGLDNLTCASLVVIRSRDRAQTFEGPLESGLCLQGPSVDVAIGRNGDLYLATWGPAILRSTDGGASWTTAQTLGNDSAPASLAVDPVTDALYVTWSPVDNPWRPSPGPILIASSRDGGDTWTGPRSILPDTSPVTRPQVAAFGPSVLVGFSSPGPSGFFVGALHSGDAGDTWGNATSVSPPDPCGQWPQPSIAVSAEGIFAVSWSSGTGTAGCSAEWGNATEVWVATSRDGALTFSEPARAGGPSAWAGAAFGDATAFNDEGRLYVAWRSIAPEFVSASVYVANSTDLGATFERVSFETRLREPGGNLTAQENLAPGPDGTVYLAWTVVNPFLGPNDPSTGIFVRSVAGEAVGDVVVDGPALTGSVDIELRDPQTDEVRVEAAWTGSPVVLPEVLPDIYPTWIRAGTVSALAGDLPVKTWGRTTFSLRIEAPGGQPNPPFPWPILAGLGAGAAVGAALLLAFQYTRLVREDVLQRKVRVLLYEHVRDHPGSSFSAVRDAVGLQNGVAAYHLAVLEKQGLIHSEARRRRRWYYPNGDVSLWQELPVSPLQRSILQAVERSPGIGVRELARSIRRRASSVTYNVGFLSREGLLRAERAGVRLRCYPAGELNVAKHPRDATGGA